jgi:hypothetical protein
MDPTPVAPGQLAAARVRRLTSSEYARTVEASIGPGERIEFPVEALANGYDNRAEQLIVGGVLADRLFRETTANAERAAAELVASAGCGDEACARTILGDVATRAYRRPVSEEELADLIEVFRVGIEGTDFTSGIALALEVVLQSAEMLYHAELGEGGSGATITLTPYEVAEQVAYTLTAAPPDDLLLGDAASGAIMDATIRAEHARRLLSTAASAEQLGDFAVRWLEVVNLPEIGRSSTLYPEWPAMRQSALAETRQAFARAIIEADLDLGELLTSKSSAGDETMAAFYGATRDADGRLSLPPNERFGILTHASVLARHSLTTDSAPVHRGKLVRVRLLCQSLTGPPPDLVIMPPAEDPTATSRERWERTTRDNATCWTCHQSTDPIGYGFENYDAIGRYRATDRDRPVNAASELTGSDVDGAFSGPDELTAMLASSAGVRQCFAQNWLEYTTGRQVDPDTVSAIASDFVGGGSTLRDLMVAIVRSDAFVTRTNAM